ncbi:MAG TPA: FAD-dependent monooxygenase [Pseudolabrys sp.]|nr:FAD-dependent monooxygenase [Pseudolabrys sp.]
MTSRKPVVIAGAGPTGLMCALVLAKQDIPVVVCEAEASLTHDLRAGSFHPPTLEMMAAYGVTARMREIGLRVRHWQIRDKRGEYIAEFDLGLLDGVTTYPYRLHLEQHRLTPIQLDIITAETDAEIRFGHRVLGFTQDSDGVRVTIEANGSNSTIEASWLIGADGARSAVRKGTAIAFEGFTWPEYFVVASTPYDLGQHGFALNAYVSDPIEWAAVFKVPDDGPPGLWRAAFYGDPEKSDAELLDPAHIEQAMQRLVRRDEPYEIRYKSIYRVHQRVAGTFREGRVLLAGDAAHLNNPLGGFGLNSGIHDAVNLAEKLGRVWRGEDATLLDRYVRQRRAATVEQVQKMSIRNKQLLQERDPQVQRRHLTDLMAIAADPRRARAHMLESSMIMGLRRANAVE